MVYIIMGVLGSGKTSVGVRLAEKIDGEFRDADDYHPAANREKMAQGIPLNDLDRKPWLAAIKAVIDGDTAMGNNSVMACSALKEAYRRFLMGTNEKIKLVYLKGTREVIGVRIKDRKGHFVNPSLLDSQFVALEEPKNAIICDITKSVDEIVTDILK
jgi:carbohydrate kinase (thermoresistant glucokinase family)